VAYVNATKDEPRLMMKSSSPEKKRKIKKIEENPKMGKTGRKACLTLAVTPDAV
jgi:hypothetical protein